MCAFASVIHFSDSGSVVVGLCDQVCIVIVWWWLNSGYICRLNKVNKNSKLSSEILMEK